MAVALLGGAMYIAGVTAIAKFLEKRALTAQQA